MNAKQSKYWRNAVARAVRREVYMGVMDALDTGVDMRQHIADKLAEIQAESRREDAAGHFPLYYAKSASGE